jgi:ribosomal protein L37E
MKGFQEKMCLKCGFSEMKEWENLTDEEKMLAERLPMSAEFARRERETHLFCPRCWHEEAEKIVENC